MPDVTDPNRIVLEVPGEPMAKGRPRSTKAGVVYTPGKTRTREGIWTTVAIDAMAGRPPLAGPVEIAITAVFGIPKSMSKRDRAAALAGTIRPTKAPDSSNIAKLLEDGLNSIVYVDDKQIVQSFVRKVWGDVPRIVIVVQPWPRQSA